MLKNQEKEHDNKLFTLDVIRSFNMADQLGSDETSFLPYGTNSYVIYQIYIDEQEKERQHMLKHDLFRSIDDFCRRNLFLFYYAVFFNTNGELCVILSLIHILIKGKIATHAAAAAPFKSFPPAEKY